MEQGQEQQEKTRERKTSNKTKKTRNKKENIQRNNQNNMKKQKHKSKKEPKNNKKTNQKSTKKTRNIQKTTTDFSNEDKKLSHVNRGASSTKPVDGAGGAAGLDTMAEATVVVGLGLGVFFCLSFVFRKQQICSLKKKTEFKATNKLVVLK